MKTVGREGGAEEVGEEGRGSEGEERKEGKIGVGKTHKRTIRRTLDIKGYRVLTRIVD